MANLIHSSLGLRDLPYGSVVIDCDGDAWQKSETFEKWIVVGIDDTNPDVVIEDYLPVEVVYTPDEA